MRPLPLAGLLIAVLCGCGGGDGDLLGVTGGPGSKPNATDAAFVRAMTPHQQEAITMADLARQKALRRELRKIAKQIARDRRSEADQLASLARDTEESAGDERVTRTPLDLRQLKDPVSFDHRFMELMIRNLEDAVASAEEEQDRGGDVRLKRFARELEESHTRDLEALRRWLRTWYGEGALPGEGGGGGGSGDPGT